MMLISRWDRTGKSKWRIAVTTLLLAVSAWIGCADPTGRRLQGYLEGEFVYVSSPFAGTLKELRVERGQTVQVGIPLFALESEAEIAALTEAQQKLEQARANLADARKGSRASELEALQAQLRSAQAALHLAASDLARQERLQGTPGATTEQAIEQARATQMQEQARVARLEAELETAGLGARVDQVKAAQANVGALEAAVAHAEWSLEQKRQAAPAGGEVFDTLYNEGEWVPAGRPVVALLPPGKIKLRMYLPEERLGSLRVGQIVEIFIDGVAESMAGRVSFISPRPEFTPPMIYSRENREKFVFLVEAAFDPAVAMRLHPGQPVEVILNKAGEP